MRFLAFLSVLSLAGCTSPTSAPDPVEPRVIALGRDGEVAALELTAPWALLAAADLGAPVASARCRGDRCVVVHPSPADRLSIVSTHDLALVATIELERAADPRDVVFVDAQTIVVGQHGRAELLEI